MEQFGDLDRLMLLYAGMIHTSQVWEAGISRQHFHTYVKKRGLIQVTPSIFVTAEECVDPFYLIHLRCIHAVFSHETALYLHGLLHQEPECRYVTVERSCNPSYLRQQGVRVSSVKKREYEMGIAQIRTPMGHAVPVYQAERAICDLFRRKRKTDPNIICEALKRYIQGRERKIEMLYEYAEIFRVGDDLKRHLGEISWP